MEELSATEIGNIFLSGQFGMWLKEERKKRGWSQERVAYDAGVDTSTVSRLERMVAFPNLYTVRKIMRVFSRDEE